MKTVERSNVTVSVDKFRVELFINESGDLMIVVETDGERTLDLIIPESLDQGEVLVA